MPSGDAVHPADLGLVGMDLDDGLRAGEVEQRVALAHGLAHARADGEDQVCLPRLRHQRRIGADAEVAGVMRGMVPSNRPWRRKDDGDGDVVADEEVADRGAAGRRSSGCRRGSPAAAPPSPASPSCAGSRRARDAAAAPAPGPMSGTAARCFCISSLKRDDDRPGPPADRDVEGMRHQFRDARRVVDLRHPFRDGREEAAVVDLLEASRGRSRPAGSGRPAAPAACCPACATCTPMAAWQAPGPRVTTATPGAPGQLAMRLRHVDGAGLEAAGDQLDAVALGIEPVEQVEVAFARHREDVGRPVGDQRIGQQLAPGPRLDIRHAASSAITCGGPI